MRTDRLAARQFPGAGAVAERPAGQGANRAGVDHVARQFGINRLADKGFNFCMLAAVRHAKFHDTGDFLAEAHAACALDAAAHFLHRNQGADILASHYALFFFVTRSAATITDCNILQLTLATLVADRAIQRVVDQQKLHHRLLRVDGLRTLGPNNHAGCNCGRAGRHRLGHLLHIDQAHAATGGNAEFLVIAKMRYVSTRLFGRMDDRAAFSNV